MTYTKTNWNDGDAITAAKLNNMETQYDSAKTDFGAVNVTVTVAVQGTSLHSIGADYIVPLGATNADTYIQSAITAAVNAGGGEVLLLEGTYICSTPLTIPNNITLSGMGANTVLQMKSSINASQNIINNQTQSGTGNKNIVIKDLMFYGNKSNQTSGTQAAISIYSCTDTTGRIVIRNCFFKEFRTYGCWVVDSLNVIIDKCVFANCGGTGTDANIYAGSDGATATIQVSNCTTNGGYNGVWLYGTSDSVIAGCDCFNATGSGIALSGSNARTAITGCTLYNNQFGLWSSGAISSSIAGCTFRNNSAYGCTLLAASHYNTVVGNSLYQNEIGLYVNASSWVLASCNSITKNTQHGIQLNTVWWSNVSDNVVYKNGMYGIYCLNTNQSNISGNAVTNSGTSAHNTYANIALFTTTANNNITGNLCYGSSSSPQPAFNMYIDTGCNYNLVTANNFKSGSATAAFRDNGTSTDKTSWMASGNKLS